MGKSKRNKPQNRGYRVPRWHDLGEGPTKIKSVFPKSQSAMMVKPRGVHKPNQVDMDTFTELYSRHIKGPENTTEQWIKDSLCITQEEETRLKRNIVLKDGSIQKELWHEIVLRDTEANTLKLCFYANRAIFVEIYKAIKTIAISQPYSSSSKAMAVYNKLGKRYISWGQHRPYTDGAQGVPSP